MEFVFIARQSFGNGETIASTILQVVVSLCVVLSLISTDISDPISGPIKLQNTCDLIEWQNKNRHNTDTT